MPVSSSAMKNNRMTSLTLILLIFFHQTCCFCCMILPSITSKVNAFTKDNQQQLDEGNKIRGKISDSKNPPSLRTIKRRDFIFTGGAASCFLGMSTTAYNKVNVVNAMPPIAPIESLVPAIRVREYIKTCARLASSFQEKKGLEEIVVLAQLSDLLLNENYAFMDLSQILEDNNNSFIKKNNSSNLKLVETSDKNIKPARQYMEEYESKRKNLSLNDKISAMIIESGELDTWRRLKRREASRSAKNEMRAAFNLYTSNLRFGEDYVLNASKEERREYIRQNNALPDVKAVITADLDLRDLYRNQVLQNVDDARAELRYQLTLIDEKVESSGQRQEEIDLTELILLLDSALVACNRWFEPISDTDVAAAYELDAGRYDE